MRLLCFAALLLASTPTLAASLDDQTAIALAKPQELIVDKSLSQAQVTELLKPVDAFYGFWNNVSQHLLDQAISPQFNDHVRPFGRPQGPTGPMIANKAFRAAVPDLRFAVPQRIVVGDRVISHLRMTGHFTGKYQGIEGKGQEVDFIAVDDLRVKNGRITDNRHIEDNLTFLKQVGAVK
ncbi:ester cyclase [Rhizobium sp. NPDC090275]|uniref:ester cyclase n=1 Tax=Rhizobium sp. NPDC090275 TaxID=3364498 RepID=UPI00383B18D5